MPLIVKPSAFTCRGERLARAATSPHGSITRPSGKGQGVGPSCDASKEMTLGVGSELIRGDVLNAAFVDDAGGDVAGCDQVAEPLRGVGVDLVVEVHSPPPPPCCIRRFVVLRRAHSAASIFCSCGQAPHPYAILSSVGCLSTRRRDFVSQLRPLTVQSGCQPDARRLAPSSDARM